MPTVIVAPEDLHGEEIALGGEAYRHLFRARRIAAGERVRVVDGAGVARWSVVSSISRREAVLTLGDVAPDGESAVSVELVVPILRSERSSLLVEKTTEMGVRAIRWHRFERTPRAAGGAALQRQRRVARSAVEQSGRSRIPEIGVLEEWPQLQCLVSRSRSVVLDPAASKTLFSVCSEACPRTEVPPDAPPWLLIVGPEGGLNDAERQRLVDGGAVTCRLGQTLLRAETAAIVGVGLLACR